MLKSSAGLAYLLILVAAIYTWGAESLVQVILFGLVPVIWLDRWWIRVAPWLREEPRYFEVARRAAWFVGGVLALRLFWHGHILWHELLFLGAEITLATALRKAWFASLPRRGCAG
jgi:hypothetical protein